MDSLIDLGYWGLFIGSFLASTLIPMSADVLLVGILALGGNVWACLVIATTGNWLGGLTSYWIGWLGRWEWIERWLKVKEEKLLRQKKNIDRYGVWLALFYLASAYRRLIGRRPGILQNQTLCLGHLHANRPFRPLPALDLALPAIRRTIFLNFLSLPPPLTISTIFFCSLASRRFICRHRFIRFHRPNNFPSPFTYL